MVERLLLVPRAIYSITRRNCCSKRVCISSFHFWLWEELNLHVSNFILGILLFVTVCALWR